MSIACDAASVLSAAIANGYDRLSGRDLKEAILAAACANSGSGGTVCITGGNTPPVGVPPCAFSIWIQGPGPNRGLWFGDLSGWDAEAAIAQGP